MPSNGPWTRRDYKGKTPEPPSVIVLTNRAQLLVGPCVPAVRVPDGTCRQTVLLLERPYSNVTSVLARHEPITSAVRIEVTGLPVSH